MSNKTPVLVRIPNTDYERIKEYCQARKELCSKQTGDPFMSRGLLHLALFALGYFEEAKRQNDTEYHQDNV